jgi:hypothetical protein
MQLRAFHRILITVAILFACLYSGLSMVRLTGGEGWHWGISGVLAAGFAVGLGRYLVRFNRKTRTLRRPKV